MCIEGQFQTLRGAFNFVQFIYFNSPVRFILSSFYFNEKPLQPNIGFFAKIITLVSCAIRRNFQ